jgi:hypothetical protein
LAKKTKPFGNYKADGNVWIPLTTSGYYPDLLMSKTKDEREV